MKKLPSIGILMSFLLFFYSCGEPTIPVKEITLNKESISLFEGESFKLTATIYPYDATDPTVVWFSSDTNVASVSDGLVSAVAPGTSTITACAGDKIATCSITVSKYEFYMNPDSVVISANGGSFTIMVVCSGNYRMGSHPVWVSKQSEKDNVHSFTVEPNESIMERTGNVQFQDDKGSSIFCQLKQYALPNSDNEDVNVGNDINW